jgi:SAM-dependent methyltransferase
MVYADGIPTQTALDRHYAEASRYVYAQRGGAESAHDARRLAITARDIARLVPDRAASVLDVGCASGRLLAELRSLGFASLRGIDPSSDVARAARRLHDVDVAPATLATVAARPDRYDLVILVGVLEHLADVRGALGHVETLLAPGGAAYFEVPDVTGFGARPNAPFQELSVEHVNFFGPASLARALGSAGMGCDWLERNMRVQAQRTEVSNLTALARRGPGATKRDGESEHAMRRYIAQSASEERELLARAARIIAAHGRIIVWGAGTLTQRLLAAGLPKAGISAIVDSNPRYAGARVGAVPVISPTELTRRAEPVLILSRVFYEEIAEQAAALVGRGRIVKNLFEFGE